MPLEEQRRGAVGYSPSTSSPSARMLAATASQRHQRGSPPGKKPPEPLRRAVADCLSTSSSNLQASSPAASTEASRTLRDYIANPKTIDMTYSLLVEHALAERDRSPAVVPRCVALLKRYLLRYVPDVQTLRLIDQFCENSILECDSVANPRVSLWSKSLSHQPGTSSTVSNTCTPSVHASSFASPSLVKSLSYVRSLVARHIPKLSFQSLAQPGGSASAKQSLPSLSSFLSKSFTSHINPEVVSSRESPQRKDVPVQSALGLSNLDKVDEGDDRRNISVDLFSWRWSIDREDETSFSPKESDGIMRPQDVQSQGFLEVGAAALLVGDLEAKTKEQSWRYTGSQDLPDIDRLLQPSTATLASNSASSYSHLKAITASKRLRPDDQHIWMNVPVSAYHPRARPLFQYRHYSEQQPLRLNLAEISEVIAEVCSESSSNVNTVAVSPSLTNCTRRPPAEVAVSVLVKLVIDMYMMDSESAAPLALSMLEDILSSEKVSFRVRAFDLILNLGVHAHLLEPVFHEHSLTIDEDDAPQETCLNNPEQAEVKTNLESSFRQNMVSAIDKFEKWLLAILFDILQFLVQTEEEEEIVWASALSCLFYFVCDGGKILRDRLDGLDIRVLKTLLEISRKHSWSEIVRCRLICMLTNMFYRVPHKSAEAGNEHPIFNVEQVDLLGGIDFVCLEYSQAISREEKRNLFLVLLDYVLHQIKESWLASGASAYTYDESQFVASMLSLADAPEAFYIAVKHGVEGIGEILRRPISAAMSRSPNYERLDLLLDKVARKLDTTISTFTRLDDEFSYMIQITKSYRSFRSIVEGLGETDAVNVSLSWATLHSLLHSERSAYRHNGYIWLTELLLSEISEDRNNSIWGNIRKLQERIGEAGSQDLTSSSVPLPISIFCGLLKSKHNYIRWGFLFVLDKLLMRLKLLLDENQLQNTSHGDSVNCQYSENNLKKANAVIDIMSCALSLVVQINERDSINILKMCDILFSQLCLKLQSASVTTPRNFKCHNRPSGKSESSKTDLLTHLPQTPNDKKNSVREGLPGKASNSPGITQGGLCETASMAALLLRGHATVPMQLVSRVKPASLFLWPLIQLAGAVTDDIALVVAVGSKGGGNLPGATSDIRAALLLLLIGKCSADSMAFQDVGGEECFRGLLDDTDSRVAYYSSAFLLKRMMTEEPEKYQRMLQNLVMKAQQSNNEKLLENPYLQMCGILKLMNDPGA